MPGYRLPAASASSAEHHEACKSSLAREMQSWKFAEEQKIDGLVAGDAAERGTELHSVAAKLPFSSPDWGVEPYDARAIAEPEVKALGYGGYEAFLVTDWVRRRDQAINYALDNFPGGRAAVEELEMFLDEKRLHLTTAGGHEFSGLPDVLAVIKGGGHCTAVVCDYKSGQSERVVATENRQLAALVGLAKTSHPEITEAYAAIIAERDITADVLLAHFDAPKVAAAKAYAERVADTVGPQLKLYLAGGTVDPSPAIDHLLNTLATPGGGCADCRGKTCCGKMQEKLVHDYFSQIDLLAPFLASKTDLATMTPDKLSEILALATAVNQTAKLYDRLQAEAEQITLQLSAKGIAVPGTEITLGTSRIGLTQTDPTKLHSALGPVLAGQSITDFLLATAKPSATAVRAHLSAILGVPEPKVEETLNLRLGNADNPLKKGTPSQSVNVTRDLADILDEKRAEILAGKPAPVVTPAAPTPAVPVTAAPAVASSPAAVPAVAEPATPTPAKPRRSRKAAAPAPTPAPETPVATETAAEPAVSEDAADTAETPDEVPVRRGCLIC